MDRTRKIIETDQFIVFRVDTPDDVKAAALSRALDTDIQITRENVTALKSKKAAANYATMLSAKFPAAFVDRLYNSRYMPHFWSAEEIAAFRERWTQTYPTKPM